VAKRNPVATILTVIMDLLVVVAVADTARLVVGFFGQLSSQGWAKSLMALTDVMIAPAGFEAIKTPYGGVFEVNAAITILLVLVIEWVLSVVRSRV
jgi:hypothetical protein